MLSQYNSCDRYLPSAIRSMVLSDDLLSRNPANVRRPATAYTRIVVSEFPAGVSSDCVPSAVIYLAIAAGGSHPAIARSLPAHQSMPRKIEKPTSPLLCINSAREGQL
jgi:hypothetical protein